ncbi:MAG: PQQ-binding-like beta-propeller repeat protein [Anaerolineae bacterium]|nr:PQQ-binding-like beta-propeller repeat protein [Anaerolineae bacterium]
MREIFCPQCGTLVLNQPNCPSPSCGWRRPVAAEGVGAELWRADLRTRLNKPHCYPVVGGGVYCLGTEDGMLLALDLGSGDVVWEKSLGAGYLAHALATDGRQLFVGCEDVRPIPVPGKALRAFDLRNGEEVWQVPTTAHSLSAPAVVDGQLYFSDSDGLFHAVDVATRQEKWGVPHPVWGSAAPAVAEGIACVGGRGGTLAGYGASDGQKRWNFTADGWFATPPVIDGGCVYALCWDDYLYALDLHTGWLRWKFRGERGKGLTTPPAVAGGRVYVGSRVYRPAGDDRQSTYAMLALRAEDGQEASRFYTERHIFTPPAVASEMLFFGSNDGSFYGIDALDGEERWRLKVTSRAVTRPQVAGDAVVFGGRDGMVYAVRWRVPMQEDVPSPELYERQGMYEEAAAVYALQGQFERAAVLYENEGKSHQAAQLYERAQQPGKAAPLWESLGMMQRARDRYREAGDQKGLAAFLERAGEHLQAAKLYESVGELEKAAALYEQSGDRARAIELYRQVGLYGRARTIANSLGQWEKLVDIAVDEGQLVEAARILEQHGQLERAAALYQEGGDRRQALPLRVKLGHWEQALELARELGDHEQEAMMCEKLQRPRAAADAYRQAAEQARGAVQVDEAQVAALYENAVRLYNNLFEYELAADCLHQVSRYRRLPDVDVQPVAEEGFIEHQFSQMRFKVVNNGYGPARGITLQFEGAFDFSGDCCVPGLAPQRDKELPLSIRPHRDNYGDVPLWISVTYEDLQGNTYEKKKLATIPVNPASILSGLGVSTPLQINIQEMYQAGARRVEQEVQSGARVGEWVEIKRGGGGVEMTSSPNGEHVRVRKGTGPIRRCPNPECNVPIKDPEQRFCSECGAPLGRILE